MPSLLGPIKSGLLVMDALLVGLMCIGAKASLAPNYWLVNNLWVVTNQYTLLLGPGALLCSFIHHL